MKKRQVRRHDSDLQLVETKAKNRHQISGREWLLVAAIPLIMIVGIRFIAIYYSLAAVLILIGIYLITALRDYQQPIRKYNLRATIQYGLIVLVITIIYLSL